ncbi:MULTISPECIES: Myb-like DNA-binding domain-containing protein [Metabacillus]|uniref:Myb-like DNA-binding domain-containing protein n=1 Tax=Metabacillus endolithicus TaxID=1535204 RepID=A0ABW5BZJ6_9BACI|nr:Myb-like DNA-binding domain-containing protein [Metabacillus endolithicus]UPG65569.1 hypothetical protein MVE64_11690 [Metabacillus endolithicus]
MLRTYRHWTTKEDFRLISLRESGKRYKEIAAILNRTSISVEKRYRKLKKEAIYTY